MERQLMLALFLLTCYRQAFAACQSQTVTCGEHEVAINCPTDCPADYCPTSANQNQTCPEQTCNKSVTGCKCAFNYRRSRNWDCIRTEDCPPFACGPNERYVSCPAYCPTDSCADVKYNGQCPFNILIVLECFPKCQCKEGYARNNGACIPQESCPGQNDASQSEFGYNTYFHY